MTEPLTSTKLLCAAGSALIPAIGMPVIAVTIMPLLRWLRLDYPLAWAARWLLDHFSLPAVGAVVVLLISIFVRSVWLIASRDLYPRCVSARSEQ